MPVLAVNSLGVSAAMSFICGLSTMATLIEPPFPLVPEAGDPLDEPPLELELSEPPPPQPDATAQTTANRAAANQRRRLPLICSLLLLRRGGRDPSATRHF